MVPSLPCTVQLILCFGQNYNLVWSSYVVVTYKILLEAITVFTCCWSSHWSYGGVHVLFMINSFYSAFTFKFLSYCIGKLHAVISLSVSQRQSTSCYTYIMSELVSILIIVCTSTSIHLIGWDCGILPSFWGNSSLRWIGIPCIHGCKMTGHVVPIDLQNFRAGGQAPRRKLGSRRFFVCLYVMLTISPT